MKAGERRRRARGVAGYTFLGFLSLSALFPICMVVSNSFKLRKFIFGPPFSFPDAQTFSLIGYHTVLARSSLSLNFLNSCIVTLASLLLILLLGSMAAFALSEYRFELKRFMGFYLAIGIMIPIRLGTVGILRLMASLGLVNNLIGLILIYIAQGLPMTVFILSSFMSQVPDELKQVARIDGASEYRIHSFILPLVRPALGVQQFVGQFVSDWKAVLSSLTMAMVPIILLYLVFARQMIKSITAGAMKA